MLRLLIGLGVILGGLAAFGGLGWLIGSALRKFGAAQDGHWDRLGVGILVLLGLALLFMLGVGAWGLGDSLLGGS